MKVYGFVMPLSSDNSSSFGPKLRKIRENRGLSQSELAEKAGFQPSAISHFETGRRSPSFDNLRRLADALNVTIDFLLGREKKAEGAGPVAEKLFRHFSEISAEDQENLADFAAMLAKKSRKRGND
ncbi:helix-turn-helix domain-containing protein [Gimesia benthica]|nr:helix-turn-helix transcriptional regulator [Gimesia benthica]